MSAVSPSGQDSKLGQERFWFSLTGLLGLLATVSGLMAALPFSFSYWFQFNLLGHAFFGTLATVPVAVYAFVHFKRTLGIRNAALIFSGLALVIVLAVLLGTGLWMGYQGQTESLAQLGLAHAVAAYTCIALTVWHVYSHIRRKRGKNGRAAQEVFITVAPGAWKRTLVAAGAYGAFISLVSLMYALLVPPLDSPEPDGYVFDYGAHPFRPSQTETSGGGFVASAQIANSHQCAGCHSDIYQQWLSSAHRQAASDPAYVKNINLLVETRGITAARYCEGCHAPVALLTGELTPGGRHGGVPDTPAHLEGVGCMGCHGIERVVHLDGVASYAFEPDAHYLFAGRAHATAQNVHNFLIRLRPDEHREAMAKPVLEDAKLCASCHEQFMDESMNDWGWVKMQSDYTHWLNSPFSGQNEPHFQDQSSLTCQNCHFSEVKGDDPSANVRGMIHSHRSPGANTVLPALQGDKEQLETVRRFLSAARILVDIDEPHRQDNLHNIQFVDEGLRPGGQDNTPYFLYLGEQAKVRVTVTNRMVGHSFPGGTTDINQAWLHFKVSDAGDRTVYESGHLNDDLTLDSQAHTYHSVPVDRDGRRVWRHDLFRMVGEVYRNVIESGKSDVREYSFEIPHWARGPLTAVATVKYRKFNQRYARWALDHPRPVLPVVDMGQDTLEIALHVKPVVDTAPDTPR